MSEKTPEKDAAPLRLGPVQTLRSIDETKEILSRHLTSSGSVTLDCSDIEEADVSIVQVLLSARASAERLGIALRIQAPSPVLSRVMESAGVAGTAVDPQWNGGTP